jgi:hypothetical protein
MVTPIPSWVASWLIVIRNQPAGNWIIRGMEAWRVGGIFRFELTPADNDNGRQR